MSNQEATLLTPLQFQGGEYIQYGIYLAQQTEIENLKQALTEWEKTSIRFDKEKAEALLQLGKMDKVWGARDAAKREVEQLKSVLRLIAGMSFDALGEIKNQHTKIPNDPETLHYCGNCKHTVPKDATSCPNCLFVFTQNDRPIKTMVLDPAKHPPTSREQDIARAFEAGVESTKQEVLKAETDTRHWREEAGKLHGKVRGLRDALTECKRVFEANQNLALAKMCQSYLS